MTLIPGVKATELISETTLFFSSVALARGKEGSISTSVMGNSLVKNRPYQPLPGEPRRDR